MRQVLHRYERKSDCLKFKKPCLDCGALSYEHRCPTHLAQYKARQAERYKQFNRKEKKRNLYNNEYRKQAKALRDTATHCYLCGEMFTDRTQIQIDHVLPSLQSNSPLAPSHARCNSQKSDNDYNPNEWPRGEQVAKIYLGSIDRFRR
jgi:5-methylcytosine-specific restriction endonuclease McrA